jgi:hypothetical protein
MKVGNSRLIAVPASAVLASSVFACCGYWAPPPPCEEYGRASAVFIGTVTKITETRHGEPETGKDGEPVAAVMRVDKVYKGKPGKEILLTSRDLDCGGGIPPVGEPYLMYLGGDSSDGVKYMPPWRNQPVRSAAEDLMFLDALNTTPPTSSIYGTIIDWPNVPKHTEEPAVGILVKLTGDSGNQETATDADGSYRFDHLSPGRHVVSGEQEGYRMVTGFGEYETDVTAHACRVVDAAMLPVMTAEIGGTLFRANGEHAPEGIDVELVPIDSRDEYWPRLARQTGSIFSAWSPVTQTDNHGRYRFTEVAPGRYRMAVKLSTLPNAQTIYWPAAESEEAATPIEITGKGTLPRYDFHLAPDPESILVRGVAQSADGSPAAGATVFVKAESIELATLNADAGGHFSFRAFEGFSYSVSASAGDFAIIPFRYSREAEVAFSRLEPLVALVLDQELARQ